MKERKRRKKKRKRKKMHWIAIEAEAKHLGGYRIELVCMWEVVKHKKEREK